jgi:hypothetical protein
MTRSSFAVIVTLVASAACSRDPSPKADTAIAALDHLDARRPVPLLPMMANHQKANMRDHLEAVQEIVQALAEDDFAAVERAATRMGFSEQMGQTCTHMGMGAEGFSDEAVAFHHVADGIAAAARDRDRGRVLTEMSNTLQRCTSCHATWKQQVVDEATWATVTGAAPPMHGSP